MTIHLVTGMQGSGKTLFLVKRAYEYYQLGKTIYSNVFLNFPFKQLDYNDIVDYKLKNAVVILDEVHQLLPSRKSLSKVNQIICDGFLSMVRKKGLIIFGSTQTQRKVDVRFREEADYIYLTEKWAFINRSWKKVIESEDLDSKIPVMISFMIYQTFTGDIITRWFQGNPFYHLYDTKQIVEVKNIKLK